MSQMFGMFKSILLAQFKRIDSQVIEVEKAITTLENTVTEVISGVHSGRTFINKHTSAVDCDDDFTTPCRKVVKRQKQVSTSAEGAQLKSNPVETLIAKGEWGGRQHLLTQPRPLVKVVTFTSMPQFLVPAILIRLLLQNVIACIPDSWQWKIVLQVCRRSTSAGSMR